MVKNNLIDLYREYIRCADMCEAYNGEHKTNIQPRECMQLKSATGEWVGYFSLDEPNFAELLDHKIRFAVAIIEDKPVFSGDIVFEKATGYKVTVHTVDANVIDFSGFSLEPPKKRTFTLNGVELPCPVEPKKIMDGSEVHGLTIGAYNQPFWFLSKQDRNSVRAAIINILSEARDK